MRASGPCWKCRVLGSSPRGSAVDVGYDSGIRILFSFSENLRPMIHNHKKQSWNVLWLYIMTDGDSPQYFGIGSNYILKSFPLGRGTSPLWSLTRLFLHGIYHVLRLCNPFTISPSLDYKVHKSCSFVCSLVYHVHKTMPLHNDATLKYFWRSKLPKLRITTELRQTSMPNFHLLFYQHDSLCVTRILQLHGIKEKNSGWRSRRTCFQNSGKEWGKIELTRLNSAGRRGARYFPQVTGLWTNFKDSSPRHSKKMSPSISYTLHHY